MLDVNFKAVLVFTAVYGIFAAGALIGQSAMSSPEAGVLIQTAKADDQGSTASKKLLLPVVAFDLAQAE
jgi:hypothetical protein